MEEKIVETKNCKQCNISFEITDKDLEFYEKISPIFDGKKYSIPTPILCPDCRQRRRMSARNERKLYKRKCDLTGENIISMYSKDKPYKVYSQNAWWSDKWDPLDYGTNYNFKKSLFTQFNELQMKVPRLAIMNKQSENSDYCNYSFQNKNCYLTFGSHYEENSMYGSYSTKNKDCLDCLWIYEDNKCYECVFSNNCYKGVYLDRCEECENCLFSIDLKSCKNCILCVGLIAKEYCILNKQYTTEEYYEVLKNYNLGDYKKFQEIKNYYTTELRIKFPLKSIHEVSCENCLGDNLKNSKNLTNIFNASDCEDCKYGSQVDGTYNSMDMSFIGYDKSEYCYEFVGCLGLYNCKFCSVCWHNTNLIYCDFCFNSNDLFGCIGLKNKQYCIFNKQYTKEEYNILVPQIIEHIQSSDGGGEWGEFFSTELSPFSYNETVAVEHYPLSKEEVLNRKWKWRDEINEISNVEKIITANKLPDNIKDIPDDILNWAIQCDLTKNPYRITPYELKFYRENNLPIPHLHPEERNKARMSLLNPKKIFDRDCGKCGKNMKTTYGPESKERVYCKKCYDKSIY